MSSDENDDLSESELSSSTEFSGLEDDELRELFDTDEEEDEFSGFDFNLPENMRWERQPFDVNMEPFTITPGPTINLPDSDKAVDFFSLFFTEETFRKMVEFTNKNARKKQAPNWQPVTSEELKAFLAVLIITNDMIVVPRDERYYLSSSETKLFHIPGVKNVLRSRKRFFQLKSYIFFCDPDHEKTEEEKKDPLYKVRGLYHDIVQKFKNLFNCSREISIDEAMVPFKGKLSIKVRMPDKPIKFGVKFFELCDAKTGYCKNFSIYAGKDDRETGAIGKTGKIVMDLVADLHHTNHHLYVDNFYTSPILFLLLRARGIFAAGTARPRRGYPHEQLKRTVLRKRGEVAWLTAREQGMTALRWKDKKDVHFLTTIHSSPVIPAWVADDDSGSDTDAVRNDSDVVSRRVKERGRWVTKNIYRPEIVKCYNQYMGGVDLSDQMTAVNKSKKQKRWYLRIFLKIVLLSIYNAYILEGHKRQHIPGGRRRRDLLTFKEDLCVQLVGNFPQQSKSTASNKRRRSADTPLPARLTNVGSHFPFKGQGRDHRCVVCERKHFSSMKTSPENPSPRHKTTFKCCQCGVYLCIGEGGSNCFYDYHTKEDYAN